MRPLIIANIERIEASRFFVAILYGEDGYQLDQITVSFEGYPDALSRIQTLADFYKLPAIELWTSDPELYKETLNTPGIAGSIKHASDTRDTQRALQNIASVLPNIFEIKPIKRLPKWKTLLINGTQKFLKFLEGERKNAI